MTSREVARYLEIPIISVGQLVYEGKLEPISFDNFRLEDVEVIRDTEDLDKYR